MNQADDAPPGLLIGGQCDPDAAVCRRCGGQADLAQTGVSSHDLQLAFGTNDSSVRFAIVTHDVGKTRIQARGGCSAHVQFVSSQWPKSHGRKLIPAW